MNVHGIDGWRLPTLSPVNRTSFQYGFSNNDSTDFGSAEAGAGRGLAS